MQVKIFLKLTRCIFGSKHEDSIRRHYEMVEMAAYKDSVATKLLEESKDIKRTLENRN